MNIYLKDSQIPELKGFDERSRPWLKSLAIQQLKKKGRLIPWIPAIVGVLGVGVGAYLSLIAVVLLWPSFATLPFEQRWFFNGLASPPGAILVGGIAGFIGKQFVIVQVRPYLRKLVETERSLKKPLSAEKE